MILVKVNGVIVKVFLYWIMMKKTRGRLKN